MPFKTIHEVVFSPNKRARIVESKNTRFFDLRMLSPNGSWTKQGIFLDPKELDDFCKSARRVFELNVLNEVLIGARRSLLFKRKETGINIFLERSGNEYTGIFLEDREYFDLCNLLNQLSTIVHAGVPRNDQSEMSTRG